MNDARFDALAEIVATVASRRAALALLTALGAGGSLAEPDGTAAHLGHCNPVCGVCERCKRGKCRRKRGKRRCRKGKCLPVTGQACPDGTCLSNGSCGIPCNVSPDCPSGCLCAINTEGTRFCHSSNTLCGFHAQCTDTADCPRGEQCQDCGGNTHCLSLCTA